MGLPNKDEIKGKFDQVKGDLKESAGHALDNPDLENEGKADRAGGELREGYGTAKRKVGEAIEDLGKAVGK
ncbi:MAG: CsbD family protein [Acidobacteriota bacterium]|nr:CsbD family protein [Acidobacteriota bacterium]